jgi:hypothetical protein
MIKLSKSELCELASLVVFANTPYSLADALLETQIPSRINRESSFLFLKEYFSKITAKGNRNETVLGVAYLLLVSITVHDDYTIDNFSECIGYLPWGSQITEYLKLKIPKTQLLTVGKYTPVAPSVEQSSATKQIFYTNK